MAAGDGTLKVLALDGGGIHGIIPASILAYIEEHAGQPASRLFDLVVGTSTGGILALGLTAPDDAGKPKFSARALDELYQRDAGQIFQPWDTDGVLHEAEEAIVEHLVRRDIARTGAPDAEDSDAGPVPWWHGLLHPKYSGSGIESFLRTQLGATQLSEPVAGTAVAVNSFDLDAYDLAMLRSWEAEADPARDYPMWAAARATSAAPTFFPPAAVGNVDGTKVLHGIDGAVAVNDPVLVGYAEAQRLRAHRGVASDGAPVLIVSIGCGRQVGQSIPFDEVRDAGVVAWSLHGLFNLLMEGGNIASNQLAERILPPASFHRLQPPLSGPGFHVTASIDDWSEGNIANLRKAAEHYIAAHRATLDAIAAELAGSARMA